MAELPSKLNTIHRFRGVICLTLMFSAVFALERVLAIALGFSDTRMMLSALTVTEKRVVAFIAGPTLHQGNSHLFENLVYLIVFGGYVEWHLGWRRLVGYSAVIGYSATWLVLATGSVGAVGASSVTHGLESITGFVGVVGLRNGLLRSQDISDVLKTAAFSIPVVMGFGFAGIAIQTGLASSIDATDAIHAFGALVGLPIGLRYLVLSVREPGPK